MGWLIGILTFILVLNCLILCLLVLAQKPKKDTGGGLAFGGGASDALFGAGSGDLFTKMTKYATVIFFILTLTLSILNAQQARRRGGDPRLRVSSAERQGDLPVAAKPAAPAPAPAPGTQEVASTPATNVPLTAPTQALRMLSPKLTNLALPAATNTPTPPAPAPAPPQPKAEDEKK